MKIELALLSLLTIAGVGLFNFNPTELTATTENSELSQYNLWKLKHNIYYSIEEDSYRFSVFQQNLKKIEAFNSKNKSAKLGLNPLSALTMEEIKAQKTGMRTPQKPETMNFSTEGVTDKPSDIDEIKFIIPAKVDWTDKGAVGPATDQGWCGSCWAFMTVGALEGLKQIKTGELTRLSEQQLVSCAPEPGFEGCLGALSPYFAFDYARENGVQSLESYPYAQYDYEDGEPPKLQCKYDAEQVVFKPRGYEYFANPDLLSLLIKINQQPLAAMVEVNDAYAFYEQGVLTQEECPSTWDTLNHAGLISGYDLTHNPPYFLVRNSWGPSWGENGFIKLEMNFDLNGTCGLYSLVTRPL